MHPVRPLIHIFTAPGAIVFKSCMGTGSVAKVSKLESMHGTFIGCEANIHYAVVAISLVLRFQAKDVLSPEPDIEEGPGVCATAERYAVATMGIRSTDVKNV